MSKTEPLQFGAPEPGQDYQDRPTAFGIVERDGRIACVRVDRGDKSYFDLPGGAVDGDETEGEALVREFREETGLVVEDGRAVGRAAQYFQKSDGRAVNNIAGFYAAAIVRHDPASKCEDDHELVWLEPHDAIRDLRHDAHAWAVAAWLRQGGTKR